MVLVIFGIDALDPKLVNPEEHPNLTLDTYRSIETISSAAGEPSTHELWPTIITGLPPEEHGLKLEDGVAWEHPLLRYGSSIADYLLPNGVQTRVGAWLLNNTEQDAFRVQASYYENNGISTIFDDRDTRAIGIPNYVVDTESEDREHSLRRTLGDLFERDPGAQGGHSSTDLRTFYEQCLEMAMIRTARIRRALRSRMCELVFGYTSGLDLLGHVAYDNDGLQESAYDEMDDFVGELVTDLDSEDELLIVSDHGLQDGVHTHEAMVAGTSPDLLEGVESVLDIRGAIEDGLVGHAPEKDGPALGSGNQKQEEAVRTQLEDLGYI